MPDGLIEEISFSYDIYSRPQKEYTKSLIQSIPKGSIEDIRKRMMLKKNNKKND